MGNKRFKLHDDSLNTHGFRMLTAGADLEQFRRNPVMLYDHDDWKHLPIGRWENITVEGGAIFADAVFDLKDPFAAQIAQKVDDGYLNMASVGARLVAESDEPQYMLPGQKYPTITKWRLREASITPFGANHNALALYDEKGLRLELNEDSLAKLFDSRENPNETDMKNVNQKLKLADTATEDQAVEAIGALQNRAETAERKLAEIERKQKEANLAEANTLIDAAVAEQRIKAEAKPQWLKMFETDHDGTKSILAEIQKRLTAEEVLKSGKTPEDEALLKMSWDEADKSGKLEKLKEKYPDVFELKRKDKFGA